MAARRLFGPRSSLFVCASCCWASVAWSQPVAGAVVAPASSLGEAALSYTRGRGADACPDEKTLERAVVARLGYDPFHPNAVRGLTVVITVDDGVLRATLELKEPGVATPSTHRLASTRLDCATLHPALALALALAIDPQRALSLDSAPELPPSAPPRPFKEPVPVDNPIVSRMTGAYGPRTAATGRNPAKKPVPLLYGGVVMAVAAGPTTTGGFELGGGIALRPFFSFAGELRADVPTRTGASGGSVEVGHVIVQAVPCFRASNFGLCAIGAVGASYASARGFVYTTNVSAPYVAAGARLMAEVPIGRRVLISLHADIVGLVTRLILRVDANTVYKDAPANGTFGITVGGRFGDGI